MAAGGGRLQQGEVLRDIPLLELRSGTRLEDESFPLFSAPETPWLVVLSQDCDLEQDYYARHGLLYPATNKAVLSDKKLWGVLVAPGWDAGDVEELRHLQGDGYEDLQGRKKMGSTEANYLRTHRHERYYYIEPHDLTGGVALAFDLKLATAVHPEYLEREASVDDRRVAVLDGVWKAHLAHRYITYLGRVPLPGEEA